MAQLQKGHSYNPGDVVDAADLNALVDNATALKGIISEQTPAVNAATNDYIILTDTSDSGNLRKALVSSLGVGTVTTVGVTLSAEIGAVFQISVATPAVTPDIHFGFKTQTRRTFLGAPVAAGGQPSFRAITPTDTATVTPIAAYIVDCTQGGVFTKTLPDNIDHTFKLNDGVPGQVIKVWVQQFASGGGLSEVHWSTDDAGGNVQWPVGTEPVITKGNGKRDIFEFVCISASHYYGIRWGANFLV